MGVLEIIVIIITIIIISLDLFNTKLSPDRLVTGGYPDPSRCGAGCGGGVGEGVGVCMGGGRGGGRKLYLTLHCQKSETRMTASVLKRDPNT